MKGSMNRKGHFWDSTLPDGECSNFPCQPDKAFGDGAETWLRLEAAYDLAQAEKTYGKIKVRRVQEPASLAHAG